MGKKFMKFLWRTASVLGIVGGISLALSPLGVDVLGFIGQLGSNVASWVSVIAGVSIIAFIWKKWK